MLGTEFPEITQLVRDGEEASLQDTPPPSFAEFPEMVQLVSTGEEFPLQFTPPPYPPPFHEIVQLLSIGEEAFEQDMPPPITAEFLEIVQLLSVGDEPEQATPPPPPAVLPFVSLNPSRLVTIVSPLSNTTTLARCGSAGVSDIRIVVASAPDSDLTVIALPLKLIGSVISYSPAFTSTVSPG